MKKLILFFSCNLILMSCSNETSIITDYKSEIPITVTDKIIIPRVNSLSDKTNELGVLIEKFSTETNTNNLTAMQTKLNEVSELYAMLYLFNIGDIKGSFINRRINFWPVFNTAIEKNIADGNITKNTISKLGSAGKNLPGLNYLLFKYPNNNTLLAEYTLNGNRAKFLSLMFNEFKELVGVFQKLWLPNGNNYATKFKTSTNKGLNSSFNLLYNGLYNVVDNCKVTKIGKPAGLEKSTHTNSKIVESFYAQNSLQLIYNNIISVEEIFFSDDITSISEYIKSVTKNDALNDQIKSKITAIKKLILAIKIPLKDAVNSDKANIKKLHDNLQELIILMHNDVRSILSLIITGTDNDGD